MACGFCILFFAICRISCKNSRYFFNEPLKNPQPISILWKRAVDFSFNTTPPRCSLASAGGILHQTSEQLNHRIGSFRLQIIRQKLLNFSHIFRNHCLVAANDFIKSKEKGNGQRRSLLDFSQFTLQRMGLQSPSRPRR